MDSFFAASPATTLVPSPLSAATASDMAKQRANEALLRSQCKYSSKVGGLHTKVSSFFSRLANLQHYIREFKAQSDKAQWRRAACQEQLLHLHGQVNKLARELLAFEAATANAALVTAFESPATETKDFSVEMLGFDAQIAAIELKAVNLAVAVAELQGA